MLIKGLKCITFDIESLINCFTCSFYDTETEEITVFEISERKNDIKKLIQTFKNNQKTYFVGYNNIGYDNIIINYCIDYFENDFYDYKTITKSIFNLSNTIINKNDQNAYLKWKYSNHFKSIDLLTMLYSKALRVSLKAMEVTMHFENVQEMVIDWQKPISLSKIDELIAYNINDIKATAHLLNNSKKEFELREEIEKEYGIDCLSKDGMKIGVAILEHEVCKKLNISKDVLKTMGSPCPEVNLSDIILPWIKFESSEFNSILQDMKYQTISDGKGVLTYERIFNQLKYSVGVGGLHSINKPEIIIPKEDEFLIDLDAASLYPSLIIEHGFGPRHLGKEFIETYTQIRKDRLEAKHSKNKLKDTTLKLALNGVTGNLGNEYSWMYDPFAVLQIRINGQLMFLMLVEMLTKIGCKVVSANTDGLTSLIPKNKINDYYNVCKQWEQMTKLELEFVEYEKLVFKAVNDYIAVKKGITKENANDYIKTKGMFTEKTIPGKGLNPKIIPKALNNYFVWGIPINQTIISETDIKPFLISEKTGKQWTTEYDGNEIQKINRYYASMTGSYLDKWKWVEQKSIDNNYIKSYTRLCSKPVTILNKFDNRPNSERNIDYTYYISECNKIIEEIQPRQLSLFN